MEFKGTQIKNNNWFSDGKTVKVISKCGNKTVIAYTVSKEGNSYYNTEKEAEANAKLISKAPEMLQMLKDIHNNLLNEEEPFEEALIYNLIKEAIGI